MPKRLFIAVDISEEGRKAAASQIDELRKHSTDKGISWVKPENLHITVKFLGDTDNALIEPLSETLTRIASQFSPISLSLSDPRVLGKRVICIDISDESQELSVLEKMIDTACGKLGFPKEKRQFHPHLTLARIRDARGTDGLIGHHRKTQIEPVEFDVREIVLYESELKPTGSVYSRLAVFPLLGV